MQCNQPEDKGLCTSYVKVTIPSSSWKLLFGLLELLFGLFEASSKKEGRKERHLPALYSKLLSVGSEIGSDFVGSCSRANMPSYPWHEYA